MRPWERRLKDLARLLTNCGETYFDPELFRLNTNQFLQTSRTVTFIIQKNKNQIPQFDAWYGTHVHAAWANDPVMTWAKDSRNVIEKEGDLDLHSSVRLTLLFSYLSHQDLFVPSTRTELVAGNAKRLIRLARKRLSTGVADAAVLRIERRWVANSLPDRELVYALTYVYSRLYEVCASLAALTGSSLDRDVPLPVDLDPVSSDVGRVRYMKLAQPGIGRVIERRIKQDPTTQIPATVLALRDEFRAEARPSNVKDVVKHLAKIAKATFEHYGNHVPMLFLFNERWEQIDFLSTTFADQADKFIFWRSVADRAGYLRAFGVVWVSESWIRDAKEADTVATRNLPILGERLTVLGSDIANNRYEVTWDIRRTDGLKGPRVELVPVEVSSDSEREVFFLVPILTAMREARAAVGK